MITKQQKLNKIYSVIANKELSFGCKIKTKDKQYEGKPEAIVIESFFGKSTSWSGYDAVLDCVSVFINFGHRGGKFKPMASFSKNKMEIIGHPVMIGDLLDWIEKEEFLHSNTEYDENDEVPNWKIQESILEKWKLKRLSIDEQSEECIEYVYNLTK